MTELKTVLFAVCPWCYANAGLHFDGCKMAPRQAPTPLTAARQAELVEALREAKRALWRHARQEGSAAIQKINAALAKAGAP